MEVILVTYVDDIQMIYYAKSSTALTTEVEAAFNTQFNITNDCNLTWHLGVHYISNCEAHITISSQHQYLKTVLEHFGYSGLKPHDTPMVT